MMGLQAAQGALHFGATSAAMLVAFAVCEGINDVMRVGQTMLPAPHALFLPYGVLVICAWMYGWAALPLLFPAALLSVFLMAGGIAFEPLIMVLLLAKMIAVPVAFDVLRWVGRDARGAGTAANWKMLMVLGLIGSVLGNVPRVAYGPCCGGMDLTGMLQTYANVVASDMAGLLGVLVVVMLFFRVLRHG
ncbi:hypothetical protein [Fuscovulum ytuae]|uniref:Uncharacterized protein n=1 Tax=Fuscovulum ytuae TaxID=3042299 RepID=A0ABY8Q5H5_9RHOB|nr:hypothetical protein [Fuscovulum sp. YMD61]WGV16118.1 hypothetical protein QF092_18010 [Fuscovulum sp. YMD61]